MKNISIIIMLSVGLYACSPTTHNTTPDTDTSITAVSTAASVGQDIANNPGYNQCVSSAVYNCWVEFVHEYTQTNSSVDICEQFGDDNLRQLCKDMVITETAKKTLDQDRCQELSTDDQKVKCIQNIILSKWLKNSDPTVCSNYIKSSTDIDTIENYKDRCVIHIIDQLEPNEKTKWLCGLLINQELRTSCETRIQSYIDLQSSVENPQ